MSQQHQQDQNYSLLILAVHAQEGATTGSCALEVVHLENFCQILNIISAIIIVIMHCKKTKKGDGMGAIFWKGE